MNTRPHLQPFLNNSLAIRQEIQRFESVHPSIYAIYDLIELVPNASVAQQIRDHVVCIEGKRSYDMHLNALFAANISTLVFDCIL
jgi:Arf-GAP/GTPase/ANK repeat/PH domain-containing protein 1/3